LTVFTFSQVVLFDMQQKKWIPLYVTFVIKKTEKIIIFEFTDLFDDNE